MSDTPAHIRCGLDEARYERIQREILDLRIALTLRLMYEAPVGRPPIGRIGSNVIQMHGPRRRRAAGAR